MAINFSDTTPPAPTGNFNVKWQSDGSGNVSAYSGLASSKTTLTPVAGVVTLDASLGNSFLINVNANITNIIINNPTDGQEITILFHQDVVGGHTVALGSNMLGSPTITTSPNAASCYKWSYNIGDTNWYLIDSNNTITYVYAVAYQAATANYAILTTDYQIDCTANSFTVTLPTAVGIRGQIFSIKNSGSGTITLATTASQTIDGSLTQTLTTYDNITVMSNGANWIVI